MTQIITGQEGSIYYMGDLSVKNGGLVLRIQIPMQLVSELNQREHWRARHKRRKEQRRIVGLHFNRYPAPPLPVTVRMTRIAPRALDEGDNLNSSFKATKDALAEWLGVDDSDLRIKWEYAQRRGAPREYAVEIEVADK